MFFFTFCFPKSNKTRQKYKRGFTIIGLDLHELSLPTSFRSSKQSKCKRANRILLNVLSATKKH